MRICVILWGIALAIAACAQPTALYSPPIVCVPKVTSAPRIDGLVEPGEWAAAAPLSPFVLLGGRGLPKRATDVFMMYDDHNLYVAAILHEPNPAQLKADTLERDGPVWLDDALELFFDTDDQGKSYVHLAVNPKGTQYDALMQDKTADYRWRAETATLVDGWSVELELPFANDIAPQPGVAWGLSVARHVAADDELSAWDRKRKSFHELANFGRMIFSGQPLIVRLTSLGGLWLGENTAQLLLQNPSGQPFTGKISVRVMGRDRYGHFFGVTKCNIPAHGRLPINVPYRVYEDGFSTMTFSITDATGQPVWRTAPYPIMTPEVAPNISALEQTLSAATRLWARLPQGEAKSSLREELDALIVQWRYLLAQYRDRAKKGAEELEALAQFADKLRREAEMLEKQIKAAQALGSRPPLALSAVPSIRHIFPEDFGFEPNEAPTLHACRNETEAWQVVMLPFR